MARNTTTTAVVELNIARRADAFAPLDDADLHQVEHLSSAIIPSDFVQYTTNIQYSSGTSEGAITISGPQALSEIGPVERSVMVYTCTLYASGRSDEDGSVSFSLHELAQWIGWEKPNAEQYDRLEHAVAAVATIRFIAWEGRLESVACRTRKGKQRKRLERVTINSIFGFIDEADLETRERIAARRKNEHLPPNTVRTVRVWLNRRFRQALDAGVSVSLPVAALRKIGLKNHLASHLYYLVNSKRARGQPVEILDQVLEQVVRPTESWRRNFRRRVENACRLINSVDPRWHLCVNEARKGSWKVTAIFSKEGQKQP